ncbi:glycosyltransferase [Raphidocelis subcapitata]|uniref:Glycosyltransferase n=1 Tax=Raphidocelis subcapitata TaxID=307507 RepID=A0A2V0P273_9CHLO|nr:glycosyltransferase [Raphidocelis subcapitata]|eukprot:GBF91185.1 glycosyltransferase [Raphidocelis subcapitata]
MGLIGGDDDDDGGSGKGKALGSRQRSGALTTAFLLGVCLGVVVAERLYLASNRADILAAAAAAATGPAAASAAAAGAAAPAPSRRDAGAAAAARAARAGEAAAVAASVAKDPELRALRAYLDKIAPEGEVLIGVSNKNPMLEGMLDTWLRGVRGAGVSNYLVVALDEETAAGMKERGANHFLMPMKVSKSQADTGDNHSISALKFGILKKFLMVGWAVLLSDIDIAVLQNPFRFLYRDSDVEGQSDGFDPAGAYGAIDGFDDPSMGWARYAQKMTHFNMNSGLFYLRANPRTVELMQRLETRLAREKYWDQTAYNEEMFVLSHGDYKSPQVSVRVMDMYTFMNSKTLFKDVRNRAPEAQPPMPAMVHINYHPNKHERMKAVMAYYLDGDKNALAPFPGGSEPGSRRRRRR